jgi:hypothetical protein
MRLIKVPLGKARTESICIAEWQGTVEEQITYSGVCTSVSQKRGLFSQYIPYILYLFAGTYVLPG